MGPAAAAEYPYLGAEMSTHADGLPPARTPDWEQRTGDPVRTADTGLRSGPGTSFRHREEVRGTRWEKRGRGGARGDRASPRSRVRGFGGFSLPGAAPLRGLRPRTPAPQTPAGLEERGSAPGPPRLKRRRGWN
ncbi:hypothetical protein GCM10010215_58630 [Streptomyces virginiae]|uniref:Uncharacterized protein n=1 Tax=Streptomyces virginiae TaxID=1961 RepID=A0ABQ3NZ44_STRVG|nr:hypothetical protein GCM10010215_58630 [Streptomyces virginiae]GHI18042.1 hypothetical protein Scinn_75050 [Streptomyces virginiae]